jgi:hypothetical protein
MPIRWRYCDIVKDFFDYCRFSFFAIACICGFKFFLFLFAHFRNITLIKSSGGFLVFFSSLYAVSSDSVVPLFVS